jgi:hypothetical protein
MTAQTDPLLDVVDMLTKPHTTWVMQANDAGIQCKSPVVHEGLIKKLREAIASNVAGAGGAGKAARERVPLDADAMMKYGQVEAAIGERFRNRCEGIPGELPEDNLRVWFLAFSNAHRAGTVSDSAYFDEVATLEGWVRTIEEKISPSTKRELVGETCPDCGFAWYDTVVAVGHGDSKEEKWVDTDRQVALTVTYRPDQNGGLTESFAKCGNCGHVWMGSQGIRALAYELEHPKSADSERGA